MLAGVLADYTPVADDLDARQQYIVDGTLLPCWSWGGHRELYSGKHKTTGLSVQVACRLDGTLAWISDAINGSRHDTVALKESGVLLTMDPSLWIGDKGYIGNDMLTPIRKPAHRDFLDWENTFNTEVNKIRYVIEQTIAHFKTWRILHTDYRRTLKPSQRQLAALSRYTSTRSPVDSPHSLHRHSQADDRIAGWWWNSFNHTESWLQTAADLAVLSDLNPQEASKLSDSLPHLHPRADWITELLVQGGFNGNTDSVLRACLADLNNGAAKIVKPPSPATPLPSRSRSCETPRVSGVLT